MLYKIVIADDEDIIGTGLKDLIPWQQLGFLVDKVFTDGQSVIDYISENEVHVIFTDIKMTNISGIDIARYVCENKLPVKIVLISAHNDFSYARQAIEYGVSNYILKPTKLPEIRDIFIKLREEIDRNEQKARQNIELEENNNRIETLLRRQFFSDIYYGAIRNREDIEKRFNLINLDIDPYRNTCCVFRIFTRDDLSHNQQIRDILYYIDATRPASVCDRVDTMIFYPLHQGSRQIAYIAIDMEKSGDRNRDKLSHALHRHFNGLLRQIQAVFNIGMEIEIHGMYDSIHDFMRRVNSDGAMPDHANPDRADGLELLENRLARLIAHARSDEADLAANIADMLFQQIGDYRPHLLRSVTCEVAFALTSHDNGSRPDGADAALFRGIGRAGTAGECLAAVKGMIDNTRMKRADHSAAADIVEATREYIANNYHREIFLDSAAEYASVSPAYLSRLFKKTTGINFTQYVMDIRMEKALEYLAGSDLKIYEISKMVGYGNIYYFYRIFKNKYGRTPQEYRSALRKEKSHED